MQREIKFRAWVHSYCGGGIPQECYNTMDYSDNYQGNLSDFFSLYNPLFFSVMQYTGLKDKNGKEIYEGDIVEYQNRIGTIVWSEYHSSFDLHFVKIIEGLPYINLKEGIRNINWPVYLKIIGNIYENPEILENE